MSSSALTKEAVNNGHWYSQLNYASDYFAKKSPENLILTMSLEFDVNL